MSFHTLRGASVRRPAFVALPAALLAIALSVATASAHVSVQPTQVAPNTSTTFTVRVPTEKNEPTVRVRVEFPTGVTVSRFQPVPGWTRAVETDSQQRITSVTWSGGSIAPQEFQDFVFVARTPAEAGKLSFKAFQTYQDGETVAWENPEGSQERPAAIVTVAAPTGAAAKPASGDDHSAGAGSTTTAATAPATAAAAPAVQAAGAGSGGSDLPLLLSIVGLVLGLVATALSIAALNRKPRAA